MQTITDEKLDEYLDIWSELYHQRPPIEVTLYEEYRVARAFRYFSPWVYYIKYGEEVRELTEKQARRVYHWMHRLGERVAV